MARQVVFESLGRLYVKALPDGAPRRLTRSTGEELELFPSFSRDGRSIVFVEWTDEGLGQIRTVSPTGSNLRTVTTNPATIAARASRPTAGPSCSKRARAETCSPTAGRMIPASIASPQPAGR